MATFIVDGEDFDLDDIKSRTCGDLVEVDIGSRSYLLAENSEKAGEHAADRWRDMAKHDRREFACLIGEERLVQWALGESDSYGISSLDDFLDVVAANPAEDLAGYDGNEVDVEVAEECREAIVEEFGFLPTVAYRTN